MKSFTRIAAAAVLLAATSMAGWAADLAKLEGKWTTKKTKDGTSYTQVIEIKKDKFQFRILKGGDDLSLYAEGTIKVESSGPFSVAKFTNIKAGSSESDTQSVDDERVSIYMVDEESWTLATNFDKDRDNEKPSVEVYTKAKK